MRLLLRGILFAGMIFVVSCGRFAAWINAANHLPKLQGVTGKPQGRINRDCCSFRVRACEFVAPGEVGEMKTGAGRTLPEGMMFGPYKIDASQIFFVSESGLTAAFVNLRCNDVFCFLFFMPACKDERSILLFSAPIHKPETLPPCLIAS